LLELVEGLVHNGPHHLLESPNPPGCELGRDDSSQAQVIGAVHVEQEALESGIGVLRPELLVGCIGREARQAVVGADVGMTQRGADVGRGG
jgi:hypothetical protein